VGAIGRALISLDPLDGRAGPLAVSPLGGVIRLGAESPVRIRDVVGAPVLLDLGGGLAPGPPPPGRLGHRPEGLQDIAGALLLGGQAGGAPLPGQGPHELPILRAKVGVGRQPAGPALLVLAQLVAPMPAMIHITTHTSATPPWALTAGFIALTLVALVVSVTGERTANP